MSTAFSRRIRYSGRQGLPGPPGHAVPLAANSLFGNLGDTPAIPGPVSQSQAKLFLGYRTEDEVASAIAGYSQPRDSDLTSIAGLGTQTYGRSLLTLEDAPAARSALALAAIAASASASDLLTGMVPNARLSAQVARTDLANTFSQPQTFSNISAQVDLDFNGSTWAFAQIRARGASSTSKMLGLGYNTVLNFGAIQAGNEGVAFSPLALNPWGSNVLIGTTTDNGSLFQVNGASTFTGIATFSSSVRSIAPSTTLYNTVGATAGTVTTAGPESGVILQDRDATTSSHFSYLYSNNGQFRIFRNGMDRFGIDDNGGLRFSVNAWHRSNEATPKQRIFFDPNGTTYIQGHGDPINGVIAFRNASDANIFTLSSTGTGAFAGSLSATGAAFSGSVTTNGLISAQGTLIGSGGIAVVNNGVYVIGNSNTFWLQQANGANRVTIDTVNASFAQNLVTAGSLAVASGATFNGTTTVFNADLVVQNISSPLAALRFLGFGQRGAYLADVIDHTIEMQSAFGTPTLNINSKVNGSGAVQPANLSVNGNITATGIVSSQTEFRLNNLSFSRVAQIDADGGWGGGYNFNMNSSVPQRDSTGAVSAFRFNQQNVDLYAENSGSPGAVEARYSFTPSGAVFLSPLSSAFQSLSADPTTLDLTTGQSRLIKNTTSGSLRLWANDGGTIKSVPLT